MPYLISLLVVAVAIVALLMVLTRLRGPARRMSEAVRRSRSQLADRAAVLAAQISALRMALNRRRHRNGDGSRPAAAA